ncbi:MAG TPA: ferritin-like domain-containing protein [Terriglobales bacterium]|nr:ferritin-like domain-containing protein [Terriglobales bacterium]
MADVINERQASVNRRSFLKKGLTTAGSVAAGSALLSSTSVAFAESDKHNDRGEDRSGRLTRGDAAILRFLAALETIESDFWLQYNELSGIVDDEVPGGTPIPAFVNAIEQLDEDMPQYTHDNTDDEFSHQAFLNAYLAAKGASTISLERFRKLPGSMATGSSGKKRITNLTQLTIDTSWWTRYRDSDHNPDLDPNFVFPQAVPTLAVGQHTAIPRTDDDLNDSNFVQAIANTAGFHFATIEQGGSSLYPSLAEHVTDLEVLRVVLSIGPTETMHFQTWQDKAGNAVPLTATDPKTGVTVTFPDLTNPAVGEELQSNLIMPEPCPFISRRLPKCSVIRPTSGLRAATGVVKFLTDMGLFMGQSPEFFAVLHDLAADADAARRFAR